MPWTLRCTAGQWWRQRSGWERGERREGEHIHILIFTITTSENRTAEVLGPYSIAPDGI